MWLATMLVATWSIYIQDGHINRDGLLYLKQAYLIADGSWKEGLKLYPWPFFSILIAVFHKVTNIHLQVVAHAVDLSLFGIAAMFYLKILKLIHKEKGIIFYGGIILLSFMPIMDDYVGMILRDHGLWAGCMIGTYFYFKNLKKYSLKNSISWQLGFLFSGLFRPEGWVFLLLLPLWRLAQHKSQNLKKLVHDYLLSISIVTFGLVVIFLSYCDLIGLINSSRLIEFFNRPIVFFHQLVSPLPIVSDNFHLSNLLEDYSLVLTYSVLITILLFKWIKGLGVLHGCMFFYSFLVKKKFLNENQKNIYFFLVVSFILVAINLFNVYVLTNRYWGFHWWWLLILITPTTLSLFEVRNFRSSIKNILGVVLVFYVFNSFIDKRDNLEMHIAQYLKNNHLEDIDLKEHHRIKYYVNFSVDDLLDNKTNQDPEPYGLYKIDDINNIDQKMIIKKFPEINPKFILIQHAK